MENFVCVRPDVRNVLSRLISILEPGRLSMSREEFNSYVAYSEDGCTLRHTVVYEVPDGNQVWEIGDATLKFLSMACNVKVRDKYMTWSYFSWDPGRGIMQSLEGGWRDIGLQAYFDEKIDEKILDLS